MRYIKDNFRHHASISDSRKKNSGRHKSVRTEEGIIAVFNKTVNKNTSVRKVSEELNISKSSA